MPVTGHPTIRDLIAARVASTGWSQRELAYASDDMVSHQTVQDLAAAPPKAWPKTNRTILGLARALDVTPETVVLAYAASLGIPVKARQPLISIQMPPSADTLTAAERNSIVALIRTMTADRPLDGPK